VVGSFAEYTSARKEGMHAAFIGIQGGNALGPPYAIDTALAKVLLRVTLVHLTNSELGTTSNPLKLPQPPKHDTEALVAELNRHRIFVDLAHISRRDFDRVLCFHSRDVPPIVTHTGVCGARDHWRNLTDEQLRAIADRGGVVGIMYHSLYIRKAPQRARAADVARHIKHALDVCGSDAVCLGSDWDGLITTPSDMPTCLELPRLVDEMLRAGIEASVVSKVLGENFLRLLARVRP
jgi:membrane dipeptidase